MAIETYTFTDSGATHFSDIKTWLEANATEYFDSFELSEDGFTLICKIGEKTAFTIYRGLDKNYYKETIYNYEGTSFTVSPNVPSYVVYVDKIVKSSSGIAIRKRCNGEVVNNYTFITKSNKGDTSFVFMENITFNWKEDNSNAGNYYSSVFSAEKTGFDNQGTAYLASYETDYDETVLSPICLKYSNGMHLPNCMKTVYSEVIGTECILSKDGERYFYNGFIALKE